MKKIYEYMKKLLNRPDGEIRYCGSTIEIDPEFALKHGETALNNSLDKWIKSEKLKLQVVNISKNKEN